MIEYVAPSLIPVGALVRIHLSPECPCWVVRTYVIDYSTSPWTRTPRAETFDGKVGTVQVCPARWTDKPHCVKVVFPSPVDGAEYAMFSPWELEVIDDGVGHGE